MLHLIPDLLTLFAGFANAYGTYFIPKDAQPDENGKIKGIARTIREPVTAELWADHLEGKSSGLGLVPINKDSVCRWGAIDVDNYAMDIPELVALIEEFKFPMVVTRTKSGGAHLWLFVEEWVPAADMQIKLREIAAALKLGTSEIFPKQRANISANEDVGNWINMPYFAARRTTRYCIDENATPLPVEAFVERCKTRRVSVETFKSINASPAEILPGGPPCLQRLAKEKVQTGGRDNALFSFAVYAKKAMPQGWEMAVRRYNDAYMATPLPSEEVENIIKSHTKKEYFYKCNDQPLLQVCNKAKCRMCKHGIGEEGVGLPVVGSLAIYQSEPPIYFLDLDGMGRVKLSLEELQKPIGFQKQCIAQLRRCPPCVKLEKWQGLLDALLKEATYIEAPLEASPAGALEEILRHWLTGPHTSDREEDIALGKPIKVKGVFYFRFDSLWNELKRIKFDELKRNDVSHLLKDTWKAEHRQLPVGEKKTRYWVFGLKETVVGGSVDTLPEVKILPELGEKHY